MSEEQRRLHSNVLVIDTVYRVSRDG